jgi:hypothetical protein
MTVTAKKLVRKGTRCVTLDYKNDFHLDIVVCIRLKNGNHVWFVVCNSRTNLHELTDGEGFALWFAGRNAVTGNNHLRKVTRLLKYLRDIKGTFSAKSVLFATVLGNTVDDWHSQVRNLYYCDVPTALKTIVSAIASDLTSLFASVGSVNTTWKYSTGRRSRWRAAIQRTRAFAWHFGQWRLRHEL